MADNLFWQSRVSGYCKAGEVRFIGTSGAMGKVGLNVWVSATFSHALTLAFCASCVE